MYLYMKQHKIAKHKNAVVFSTAMFSIAVFEKYNNGPSNVLKTIQNV